MRDQTVTKAFLRHNEEKYREGGVNHEKIYWEMSDYAISSLSGFICG